MCARARPHGLRELEAKALSVGTGADGGYLVPGETEARRQSAPCGTSRRSAPSPASARCQASVYKKPFAITGADDGLGGRDGGAARDQLADARRALLPDHGALRHAGGDVRAARRLAPSTSTSGSPRRCATPSPSRKAPPSSPATAPTSRRASSTTPRSPTARGAGATSASSSPAPTPPSPRTDPGDKLIDLIYALKSGYRANGTFVLNRATQAAIRKMKDGDGNYIWQPGASGRISRRR